MLTVGASAAESATEAPASAAETTAATVEVSDEALAAQANAVGSASGMGFIGAALAIGLSAIGAGIALAGGAPAAIGAIAENPKSFGKAMIFVVLGEAVALYGLVVAMLIIFLKIPDLSSFVG
ncbi:MAG: ATPase [Clostridia bacterium]|nr:ATPase [Clostridia bacterium]